MQDLAISFMGSQRPGAAWVPYRIHLLALMKCAAASCPQLQTLALGMNAGRFLPSPAQAVAETVREVGLLQHILHA